MATGDDVQAAVGRINQATDDVQNLLNALADKLRQGGDTVVRAGNAATGAVYGAAAGARTGAATPTQFPAWLKYGAIAGAAWLLFRRR